MGWIKKQRVLVNNNTKKFSFFAAKCIDSYIFKRSDDLKGDAAVDKTIDPRQEGIVNKMFQRCFEDQEFKQALGIAVETRRMDMFKEAINKSVG
jgi:26S proteasome regulatory subunit N2